MNLTNTLKKLNADKQPAIFYTGGIDLLCQLIKEETTRTAFRVNNGFDLLNSHSGIVESDNENLSEAVFNLMVNVCEDDGMNKEIRLFIFFLRSIISDENIKKCLESKFFNNYLTRNVFLSNALKFLVDISLKNQARLMLLQKVKQLRFIEDLMSIINKEKLSGIYAAKLLSNLAIELK